MTRIAICAPGAPIRPEVSEKVTALAKSSFPHLTLDFHPQCFAEAGHFAGIDEERLLALLDCANDPTVDAVWFARGGYGSDRIAEDAIARMNASAKKKAYIGYSDCGYLLAGLYRNRIGRPISGPMPVDVGRNDNGACVLRSLAWFAGSEEGLEPTIGKQPTVAFNLITLVMLSGTPLMPDLTGHVVMVEEVHEYLYAIDRLFFALMPYLKGIAGLRLGSVTDVPENDRPFGQTAEEIAQFWCERAGVPYLGRAEFGHTADNRIVPFGLAAPPLGA
ncbi:LD-carboxypeptidase [Tsuneonella mangrovi]|uniref:LD-carboxypeptidase n=1 Tax=Tsuneonella mangrovi TaxID=1982042 RepID=UPI000BA1CC03|nr:LD-carboxypeptidase [Tsuneonella mangrovi]